MVMVAKAAEDAKRKKYATLLKENKARFLTAAMESTGGMGKELRELIEFVSLVSKSEMNGWDATEVTNGIRCAAAVAIQVGNARVIMESRRQLARRAIEWDRSMSRRGQGVEMDKAA